MTISEAPVTSKSKNPGSAKLWEFLHEQRTYVRCGIGEVERRADSLGSVARYLVNDYYKIDREVKLFLSAVEDFRENWAAFKSASLKLKMEDDEKIPLEPIRPHHCQLRGGGV